MNVQEAEHGLTDLAMNNSRFHGDEYLLVKFFKHPKLNQAKTSLEGRPIYEEKAYIQIMQPGNKDSIVIRPATKMDKSRFAEHFRKFEAREDQQSIEGTILEEWPGVTRSQCEELKYLNIRTVEHLANITDVNAQNIMGVLLLKQKAIKYLETSATEATATALADLQSKYDELAILVGAKATDEPQPTEDKPEGTSPLKPKRTRRTKAQMEAEKIQEEIPPKAA